MPRVTPPRRALALILLLALLVIPALPPAAVIVAAAAQEGGVVYADPAGRFTVPVPSGWTVEERDGVGVLSDPEGQITVYALAVEAGDPVAAVADAWRRVDPAFDRRPLDVQEPPPPPGIARVAVVTYDIGEESGRVVQGVAQTVGGVAHVLLFDADLLAAQRRAAQLATIQSGFTVAGVDEVDLTGVRPTTLGPAHFTELDAYVADVIGRTGVPGAAYAVVQDGRVVHSRGVGVRARGEGAPVTPDTLMMIGSITKSMTTMMTATLVDEGRLSWDTPAVEVLPGFAVADPAVTPTITIRNLFCACTGVPRRDLEFAFNADDLSADDTVASLRSFEFFTPFGEAFQYSNQMVATGGYAAAAASGTPGDLYDAYETAMERRVLEPIGMTDSTFSFESVRADGHFAVPHGASFALTYEPLPLDVEEVLAPIAPAGALWSSASEMARYAIAELNRGVGPDGNRVVSEENLAVTWEPQVPVDDETSYGLGWIVGEYKGAPLIEHGGNTFGFTADLAFLPEGGLGVVVLANAQAANVFTRAVRERLFEIAYDQPFEFDAQVAFALDQGEQAVAEIPFADEFDPAAVEPFVGEYANAALGKVDLTLEEEILVLDAGEFRTGLRPLRTEVGGPIRFLTADAPVAGLPVELRQENGRPVVIVGQGVAEYRFTPAFPDPPILPPRA